MISGQSRHLAGDSSSATPVIQDSTNLSEKDDGLQDLRISVVDPLQPSSPARPERQVSGWSGHRQNGHELQVVGRCGHPGCVDFIQTE